MSFNPDLHMTYTQETQGKAIVFRLEGSLMGDSTQQQFKEAILSRLDAGQKHFILDLSAVRNVNSSGLGSLITLFSRTRSAGGEFILASVPANVRNLLHITRLDTVFPIRDTLQEALQSIQ
ncbi:MAG: STAS domain-containing protein [Bacteroidia bacterium]|nr:STAS domain-containing protein [Bacteroidia bacterium]MCX7651911.1 STAS domain-containing protein [Bacteroidia bacterium]MDW8416062.1 STAS domain-containing protein [Bacteroidia bacterium]